MKTNFIANNSVINTIMKSYMRYICAVVLLIGTCASAWGAYNVSISHPTLTGVTQKAGNVTVVGSEDNDVYLYYNITSGYDPDNYTITVRTKYGTFTSTPMSVSYAYNWTKVTDTEYSLRIFNSSVKWKYNGNAENDFLSISIVLSSCTDRSLTFANSSVAKTFGDAAGKYQNYALSTGSGTVTWASSNTDVATVNSSGTVTIVGAGSTDISVTVASDGTYCEKEASYTLNVAAVAPTLSHNTTGKLLAVSSITSTGATISGGVVTAKGGANITQYGFVVGTASSVTYGSGYTARPYFSNNIATNTAFESKSITGLTPNTTYYVKATAYNGSQRGYSSYISFTTLQRYTISYDANTGSGSISSQYKDHGATATLNAGTAFSKTGYTLSRWDTNSGGSGTSYDLSGSYTGNANLALYAIWTANEYTITLNNQSATSAGTTSITATYNANTNLNGTPAITVPTKTGYTFGGYYTGTNGGGTQVIAENGNVIASVDGFTDASKNWIYANSIELYAKWTANTINLTLSKNGVTGTDGSAKVRFDSIAVRPGSITHAVNNDANYHLVGYYAEAGTTTKVLESNGAYAASTVSGYITDGQWTCATSPTTLYAKWTMTIYTVTFNMHGHGDAIAAQDVESGSKVAVPAEPEVGDAVGGWRFLGWFTDDGAGSATNTEFDFANTTVTSDITIHAKWSEITYNTAYKAWCEPDITISGDIHLTSVNGIAVYATSTTNNLLRIQSEDLAGTNKLEIKYLDADDSDNEVDKGSSLFRLCNDGTVNFNVADGSQIDVSASNTYDQTFSISYTPTEYNVINHYKLQITMKRNTSVLKTVTYDIYGRSLPEEFVIATKGNDGIWYALPNTIVDNTSAVAPVRITVNHATTPTAASSAPATTVFKGDGRYAANSNRYAVRFTDGVLNNEDKLNHLQISSSTSTHYPWLSYTGSSTNQDWWLSSTNCSAYTMKVPTSGATSGYVFGIYGGNIGFFNSVTSGSIYLLPITNKLVENEAIVTEWGKKSVILDVDAQTASGAQARIGGGAAEKATSFGQTRTSANDASIYNYTLSFSTTDFSAHKGELLYIDWLDGEDNVISTSTLTIPWIIASSGTMSEIESRKTYWSGEEVHVLPGATLTADANTFSGVAIKQLEIYPGATVNVTTGTLDVTTLILRNGWTRAGGKNYDVARLNIESTANLTTAANKVFADWYIDFDQYYPIAVPWEVDLSVNDGSKIWYRNTNSKAIIGATSGSVRLRYYDGASRAGDGQANIGDSPNWKLYGGVGCATIPTSLKPAKGYAIAAKRPKGKAFSIIRMPLTIPSNDWTASGEKGNVSTTHKDTVYVKAWGVSDESKPRYTVGWNFIANPYMALYRGPITHSESRTDEYDIEYVNIPDTEFKEFGQYAVGTLGEKLKPSSGFLIQTEADGYLTFGNTNRVASAPSYRNEQKLTATKQKAYITLTNTNEEDVMGLIVSERYTAEYELNADLQKLLSDGNTLRTYMRYGDMNMAYVAINEELAKEWIPVIVRLPENGEYTFALHNASTVDELEGVYLIDYLTGETTNLLYNEYTFFSQGCTLNNRFAINAIVGDHKVPTVADVTGLDKNSKEPIKFIWHDNVYILHQNVIYDSTGKRVNVINK